ncbi:unnamed protein product [Oppiella nova]|uniref:Uncharacterized protein n=1 Tax=Oppiella nova TaxID=334625 RepID=A0A7R9QA67_9ACAR|nr:unnamed protein product [Oppiella nova]CAG2161680.1 unnamed protein product [Oppiella nova]
MKGKASAIKGSIVDMKTDVIERLFMKFMAKIERTRDTEEIQKEHQILLSDIISLKMHSYCLCDKILLRMQ